MLPDTLSRATILGLAVVGCGDASGLLTPEPPVSPVDLVQHADWRSAGPEPFEFEPHAPSPVICPSEAWRVTGDGALDVDTGACNYLALEQPARVDVSPGGVVEMRLAHLQLYDPTTEISRAHVALAVRGEVVWSREVPIPSAPAVHADDIVLTSGVRVGDPILFHLHNHGANEWKLLSLRVVAP